MTFKPITVDDKNAITAYTQANNFLNCDFAFSNMCSWRFLYDSEFTVEDDFLFVRFYLTEQDRRYQAYMFPIGSGDFSKAIEKIDKDAQESNYPLCIRGVTPDGKIMLENHFPGVFTFSANRNYFDYIYLREELRTLKGKKYQPKRNHINKFKKNYAFTYSPITPEMIPQCLKLEQQWIQDNYTEKDLEALTYEGRSLVFGLTHFKELNLTGGAIIVDNEIVAFTYGSPINRYTFGVHVEKADIRYEGIFSVINQEFISRLPEHYLYINREEDLGIPGLRKSKLSYQPVIILEKNMVRKKQ